MSKLKEIRDAEGFAVLARRIPQDTQSYNVLDTFDDDEESSYEDEIKALREERDGYRSLCLRQADALKIMSVHMEELVEQLEEQGDLIKQLRQHAEEQTGRKIKSSLPSHYLDPDDDDGGFSLQFGGDNGIPLPGGPENIFSPLEGLADLFHLPKFDGVEVGFDPKSGFRFGIKTK